MNPLRWCELPRESIVGWFAGAGDRRGGARMLVGIVDERRQRRCCRRRHGNGWKQHRAAAVASARVARPGGRAAGRPARAARAASGGSIGSGGAVGAGGSIGTGGTAGGATGGSAGGSGGKGGATGSGGGAGKGGNGGATSNGGVSGKGGAAGNGGARQPARAATAARAPAAATARCPRPAGGALRERRDVALARSDQHHEPERLGVQPRDRAARDAAGLVAQLRPEDRQLHPEVRRRVRRRLRHGEHPGGAQLRQHRAVGAAAVPLSADRNGQVPHRRRQHPRPLRLDPHQRRRRLLAQADLPEPDVARQHLHGRAVPRPVRRRVRHLRDVLLGHDLQADAAAVAARARHDDRAAVPRLG